MKRPLVTMARAHSRLDSIESDLVDCHLESFALWVEMVTTKPEWVLPLEPAERAQLLHAHVRGKVLAKAETWKGATPTKALDFFAVAVEPDILLRFKYIGGGAPRNYPTYQQRLLAKQQFDEDMLTSLSDDGVDGPLTLLTCGYRLNIEESAVSSVTVRRDVRGHPPWEYPIYGEADGIVEPLRMPNAPEVGPQVVSRRKRTEGQEGGEAR